MAEGMLARLDELSAMLVTVRAEGKQQREALEPVLESVAAGLGRDFAFVDSVEDTLGTIRGAVEQVHLILSLLF